MKLVKSIFLEMEQMYKSVIDSIIKNDYKEIDGRLEVSKSKNRLVFFHIKKREDGKLIKKYITNKNLICNLAQKSYNRKLLSLAKKRLKQIKAINKDYEDFELEAIFEKTHENRKKFIKPILPTKEEVIKLWKAEPYKGLDFANNFEIITKKGERVRSKSEKILADMFFDRGIEYKYEAPLKIGNKIIYPDFTFLDPYTYQEIYWEHNGMTDNEEYKNRMIEKIEFYEMNGIFRGDRLIVTYESSVKNLNYQWVEVLINKYLIRKI